jgi:hypothetical protein
VRLPHPQRRTAVVVLATIAAASTVRLIVDTPPTPVAEAAPLLALCGSERWPVKTFSDSDRKKVNLSPRYRTVKQLGALPRESPRPQNGRTPAELRVYRVTATVMTTINEDDSDVHLILQGDDGAQMIAEAPEPACAVDARDKRAINRARLVAQDIEPGTKVVAIGLGFFDFAHHQTGHARNYFELHPLLSLKRLG